LVNEMTKFILENQQSDLQEQKQEKNSILTTQYTQKTYFSSNFGFNCLIGSGFFFRIPSGSLDEWCSSLLFLIKSMTSWKMSCNRIGKSDLSRITCSREDIGRKISGNEHNSSCIITKPLRHSATDRSTPALPKNILIINYNNNNQAF
jgi:hypothetical protein